MRGIEHIAESVFESAGFPGAAPEGVARADWDLICLLESPDIATDERDEVERFARAMVRHEIEASGLRSPRLRLLCDHSLYITSLKTIEMFRTAPIEG